MSDIVFGTTKHNAWRARFCQKAVSNMVFDNFNIYVPHVKRALFSLKRTFLSAKNIPADRPDSFIIVNYQPLWHGDSPCS